MKNLCLNKNRELLINKLIEKCPKVNLHTIIEFNKFYNKNYSKNEKEIININNIINNYLMYNIH